VRPHDIVLLHGQPGIGSEWQPVLDLLPAQVRAATPDRPGYGSSRLPGGGLDGNTAAVLADLDDRGVERAVVVGHSYGGGVAMSVAATAPDRVEALILLASVGPDCLNGWDRLLAAPVAGPACSLVGLKLTPWLARARMRGPIRRLGFEAAARKHVYMYVWGFARWDHGPLWRTFLAEQRALVREAETFAAMATQIRVPVLLMADRKDSMVPFRTAVALSEAFPDARLRVIEGAGHHLPLRAPEEVAAAITGFLESLDGARTGEQT
jgi:pimeloyl-ACP methyl ester carboxylesterase